MVNNFIINNELSKLCTYLNVNWKRSCNAYVASCCPANISNNVKTFILRRTKGHIMVSNKVNNR